MSSSSDDETPAPPLLRPKWTVPHSDPPHEPLTRVDEDKQRMSSPPSIMSLDIKKSTFVRSTTQIMKMAMVNEDAVMNISGKMLGDDNFTGLCNTVIASQRKIEILNAKMNDIGPKGAAAIASLISKIKTLTHIRLNRNRIHNEGIMSIAKAIVSSQSTLRTLQLSYNSISDSGVSSLAMAIRSSSISFLQLSMNRITDVGAIALFKALPGMKSIKSIYLNGNTGITDLSICTLANTLPLNLSIRLIRLDDCGISTKGIQVGHDAVLENAKRGGLVHIVTVHADAPRRVRRKSLHRRFSKMKVPDDEKHTIIVRKLNQVESKQRRAFTRKDVEDSLECGGGSDLDLRGYGIRDKNMAVLCTYLLDENCDMGRLTSLNLSWNILSDDGMSKLVKALQDTMVVVESLNLSYITTDSKRISSKTWSDLGNAVKEMHALKTLVLKGNHIECVAVKAICEALKNASELRTLKLGRNCIHDSGANLIANHILRSPHCGVRSLDLGNNKISAKGVTEICEAFEDFENMQMKKKTSDDRKGSYFLKFGGCPIMDEGAFAIAQLVSKSMYLGQIDVSSCNLTDEGILAISKAIKANHEKEGSLNCVFFEENNKVSTSANEKIAHEMYHHRSVIVNQSRLPADSRKKIDSLRIKDKKRREVEKRKKTVKANLDNPDAREKLVKLQVEMRAVVARAITRKFMKSSLRAEEEDDEEEEEEEEFARWTQELKEHHDEIRRVVDLEMTRIKGLTKSRTKFQYKMMGVRWELLKDIQMDNESTKPHVQPVSSSLHPHHHRRLSLFEDISKISSPLVLSNPMSSSSIMRKNSTENLDIDLLSNPLSGHAMVCRVYAQSLASYFKICCEQAVNIVNNATKISDLDDILSPQGIPYLDFNDTPENLVKGKRLSLLFGPIKRIERAVVKAEEKQDEIDSGKIPSRLSPSSVNNLHKARNLVGLDYILDWLRATVCAQDPYLLSVFFAVLQQSPEMFRLQRVKNKFFDESYEENIRTNVLINLFLLYPADKDSYRASKLLLGKFNPELVGRPLTSCEIQLTLNDFLTIKRLMHTYYEIKRSAMGAMSMLKHPMFMDDFTLEPRIPDVVIEIKQQEASIRRVTHSFISKLRKKARSRKCSVENPLSPVSTTKEEEEEEKTS